MPLISVIIPIFRVESYIIRCLDSVCNQTFKDFEIILVDDCTDDKSVEFAVSFLKKKDVSFQLISHAYNQGLSAARNTGITHALGEFIYFLDGDDTISENCLEVLMNCFNENSDIDFSMAKYCRVFQDGNKREVFSYLRDKKTYSKNEIIQLYSKRKLPWNAVNRLIRKSFILKNKCYFRLGISSEDLMWNFEVLHKIDKVTLINTTTYNYYITSNSIMTSSIKSKYFYDLFYIMEIMKDLCFKYRDEFLINYFLIIKYEILVEILLWNRMPINNRLFLLRQLYQDRFHSFFSYLSLGRKFSFILPTFVLSLMQYLKYQLGTYSEIIKNKIYRRKCAH